tara:strand:- start:2350 stop:2850 length:501 start_codon:yes stop_codon:yes gene_type:complete
MAKATNKPPFYKTGPLYLHEEGHTEPVKPTGTTPPAVEDEKEGTARHPGFEQSYYGRGFQASGEESGVVDVLNRRAYDEGRKEQIAWEANNEFPKQGDRLTGRHTSKYRINQINKDGSYTLSPKDDFRSNQSTISRRDMRLSLMNDMYVPKIVKTTTRSGDPLKKK